MTPKKAERTTKNKKVSIASAPETALAKSASSKHESEYHALIQAVQLLDVVLMETTAKFKPENFTKETENKLYTDPVQTRAERFHKSSFYCGVRFNVRMASAEDKPSMVEIFAEYSLLYDVPEELAFSEEAGSLFSSRNAVFNAWPFFRELVHSSVCRMGLPAPVLPSYRLSVKPPGK